MQAQVPSRQLPRDPSQIQSLTRESCRKAAAHLQIVVAAACARVLPEERVQVHVQAAPPLVLACLVACPLSIIHGSLHRGWQD